MKEDCPYTAKVRLSDSLSYKKEFELEGPADTTLIEALKFLNDKLGDSPRKRLLKYLITDWKKFDSLMTKLFFKELK